MTFHAPAVMGRFGELCRCQDMRFSSSENPHVAALRAAVGGYLWVPFGLLAAFLAALTNGVAFAARGGDLLALSGLGGLAGMAAAQVMTYGHVIRGSLQERLLYSFYAALWMAYLVSVLTGFGYGIVAAAVGAVFGLFAGVTLQPRAVAPAGHDPLTVFERPGADRIIAMVWPLVLAFALSGLLVGGHGPGIADENARSLALTIGVVFNMAPDFRPPPDRDARQARVGRMAAVVLLVGATVWLTW